MTGSMSQRLTISSALQNTAAAFSAKPAFIDGADVITFAEFDRIVDALAGGLRRRGLQPGERVALLFRNDWRMMASYVAVVRAGAVAVPVNNRLVGLEIASQLIDAACVGLICDSEFRPLADSLDVASLRLRVVSGRAGPADTWLDFDEVATTGDPAAASAPHVVGADDVSAVWYTSGTTGRPRGAVVTHASAIAAATSICISTVLHRNSVVLAAAPMFHRGPTDSMHLAALVVGATQVMMRSFDPVQMLDLIALHRVTHAFIVPAMTYAVLGVEDRGRFDLTSMTCWMSASAPLPPSFRPRMHAETTLREGTIYNAYGLTESLLNTCLAGDEMIDRPTSAGRACVGTAVQILDDDLREVGTGLVGEVVVNCTAMATDYLGQTAAWEATTIDHGGRKWYRTGDLGYLDDSGYLFLVDRAKDMIISGGENIYSAEVERVVLGHPGIDDVAVIGTPDERWGELVTAAVVLHDGWTIESLDLDAHCRDELAAYKRPRRVIALDVLPRNSFGKVLKNVLRDQFATGGAS